MKLYLIATSIAALVVSGCNLTESGNASQKRLSYSGVLTPQENKIFRDSLSFDLKEARYVLWTRHSIVFPDSRSLGDSVYATLHFDSAIFQFPIVDTTASSYPSGITPTSWHHLPIEGSYTIDCPDPRD